MKHCKTCRFWEEPSEKSSSGIPHLGRCRAVVMVWDAGEWEEVGRILKPEYAHLKAFVTDGSDYWAALLTLPTFGCVQHEPRKE